MEIQANVITALEKITYGIYVLTTKKGQEITGMIASWVSQVSYDPPRVMVGVRKDRYSHKIIEQGSVFALSVLGKEDGKLIGKFKAPTSEEKFQGIEWEVKKTGAPIIKETLAYMDCTLVNSVDAGDHTIFIGEIVDAGNMKAGLPMTSHDYGKVYLGQS